LNIRSFQDNKGREYVNRLNQYEENPTGIFSLYFGDLERFDSDSARSLISKVLQLMKEDGSAFASMNPDALSTQLKELFNKINDIEKGLEATLKGDNKIKAFVLSVPQKDATNAEIKYWVTSGSLANGFNERTLIQQFNIEKYATIILLSIKIVIILIIIKAAKLSIFYLNNYFILRSNTYSESEDKSDLNEYPSLSNF
jgi:hypothetical protein